MARPSKYDAEQHPAIARRLARLGHTEEEIAQVMGVGRKTMFRWRKQHEQFEAALKEGKGYADARVEESLYKRAIGGIRISERKRGVNAKGQPIRENKVSVLAPDVTACIFWLKNRRPDLWRDRIDHGVSHDGTVSLKPVLPNGGGNGKMLGDADADLILSALANRERRGEQPLLPAPDSPDVVDGEVVASRDADAGAATPDAGAPEAAGPAGPSGGGEAGGGDLRRDDQEQPPDRPVP